ncbi:MAG: hypothetical protein ACRC1K_21285, partial [Planctomycetia bacterium]
MASMNAWTVVAYWLAATAAADGGGTWRLQPRYLPGEEQVYRGTLTEISVSEGVRFEQPFDLEMIALTLDTDSKKTSVVGCFTVRKLPTTADEKAAKTENIVSSHFAKVKVNPQGGAAWADTGATFDLAPDGMPAWELGSFVETPAEAVSVGKQWVLNPAGQPPVVCKVVEAESVLGSPCVKIACTQASPNWSAADVDLAAWSNETTVWIDRKTGLPMRLHRKFDVRKPGDAAPSRTVLVKYDQTSNVRYHGQLLQDRRDEFVASHKMQADLETLTANPQDIRPGRVASLKAVMTAQLAKPTVTPYRRALVDMKKIIERAETDPKSFAAEAVRLPSQARIVGRPARNFVLRVLETNESLNPKKLKGTTAVMMLVDPTAR